MYNYKYYSFCVELPGHLENKILYYQKTILIENRHKMNIIEGDSFHHIWRDGELMIMRTMDIKLKITQEVERYNGIKIEDKLCICFSFRYSIKNEIYQMYLDHYSKTTESFRYLGGSVSDT